MESKHFDWIDIAKGIGIVLVVLGHTLVPQIRNNSSVAGFLWIFIYNFHMPLFFFLSGFLFEKGLARYTDKLKFIKNKARYLLVPYLFFSIFAYLFINCALSIEKLARVLEGGGYAKTGIWDSILSILTYNNHMDKHLWFLFSLFIVFLINILMPKLTKHPVAIVVMLGLYVSKAFVTYFGILDYVVSDFFFFAVGRLLFSAEQLRDIVKRSNIIAVIAMFLLTNAFYSYLYVHGLPSNKIFIAVLYCFRACVSLLGIFSVYKISVIIEKSKFSDLFKKLGGYSYDIYLMHAPFVVSGSMGILLAYSPLPKALCCFVVLIIGIILPMAVSKLIIRRVPIFSTIILGAPLKHKIKNP